MTAWEPEHIQGHIDFQQRFNDELTESGALVDAQGLAGPELAMLADVEDRVGDHHRWHAVRAHLLEQAGDPEVAAAAFRAAAGLATNTREQHYLTLQAERLAAGTR